MSEIRTLVLTDIVDSTALAERIGDAAAAQLWAAHDRVARDLLRAWRGREIDKTDGLLTLFTAPSEAVGFALAYHRALAGLAIPLKARAGVHVGPVSLRENPSSDVALGAKPLEVDGIAKPIAARVMALARGGQTLLTAEAHAALGDFAVRSQSRGHWRAKGIAEPFELFEVVADHGVFLPPPASTTKIYRVARLDGHWLPVDAAEQRLPAERDEFIGRAATLHEMALRLAGGARLLSIVGIGGCGKTRLAVHFAWTWLGDFPGGAWFCDLSPTRNLDGIVRAVAGTFDVPLSTGDPIEQLGSAIAARGRCLVVLDNFEQVSRHAEETLGRWLDRAGEACFIVTTREVLGLPGEEIFAVAPLPPGEAAALFLRRAQSARVDFMPTEDEAAAIDPLVRLLDCLPLAIELAAARVRVMSPAALLQRMSERFKLLASSGGRRDRQATLRATFDWSWDLLPEAEKAALAQLSVFDGGFTLESAEAVIDVGGVDDSRWPADLVHSLVDKSFVRPPVEGRFDLLSSMQEYAGEHLRTPGHFIGSGAPALQSAQSRHWAYFAALGDERAAAGKGAELHNLVRACQRAASSGCTEAAAALVDAAWAALRLRGPFQLGVELASSVASMPGLDPGQRSRVERVAALAHFGSGQLDQAMLHLESALRLVRESGDRRAEARVLCHLGDVHQRAGRNDDALRALDESLERSRESRDAALECEVRNALGTLCDTLGHLDQALTHYETGLALARAAGLRRWEGGLLGNLGNIRARQGRMADARADYEAALQVARETGDRKWEGNMLCNLGFLHNTQGRPSEGRTALEPALLIARELGHARLECIVLCNLALSCDALGRGEEVHRHYEAALVIARRLHDQRTEGQILGHLGLWLGRQARLDEARACLDRGAELLEAVSDRISLGVLLCHRAEVDLLDGQGDAARAGFDRAAAIARDTGTGADSELGDALGRVGAQLANAASR